MAMLTWPWAAGRRHQIWLAPAARTGRRWRRLGTGEGLSSARRRAGRLLHFLAPSRRRRAWERAPRAAPPWISSERERGRGAEDHGRESVKTGIADEDASVALDDKSGTKMTRS